MTNKFSSKSKNFDDEIFQQASLCVNDGDFAGAQTLYRDFLARQPNSPRALHALGVVMHRGGGNSEEAVRLIRQAIKLKPDYIDARCNLGKMLVELRRFYEAEECYKSALEFKPDLALAWQSLGDICYRSHLYDDALTYYEKASKLSPDAKIFVQIGIISNILGCNEDAVFAFRSALAIEDDCGEAYYGLAKAYEAGANLVAARAYALQALKSMPSSAAAMQVIAGILLASGRGDEALEWYRRAVDADGGALAFSNMLFAMNYSQNCSPDAILEESCRWQKIAAIQQEQNSFPLRTPGRLRIGYISPDFKLHSVAFFFEPLLKAHNRKRFEIHCYSNVLVPDIVTARMKQQAEYWRDIRRLSDDEATNIILEDRIDILIDLAGHSAESRLGIFARKAAPIQMTWLGYPNTTGISTIDYRITDAVADPAGISDTHHSERLIRLPECFLCYQPPEDAPDAAPPPSRFNGYITFGSFNNLAKITSDVVDLWSRILLAVPNSRLLLKTKSFCDPEFAKSYSDTFVDHGLSADRIICVPATESVSSHLAIYNQIDIALDPFPYNGTTTTFEALYMGAPVIVLRGDRHAGRVGASILTNLGLSELIADTRDDYLARTVSLCGDTTRLLAYHAELRNRLKSSVLVDADRFADTIEDTYRTVWETYCPVHPASLSQLEDDYSKAQRHFMRGEYDQTRSIYESILAAYPDNPRALHGLGIICYRFGDSESAIRNISRAIQLNRNYPGALSSLGNIYKETGRVREAIDYFRQALDLNPGYCEFHSNILISMQYLPELNREEIYKESQRWADYHARRPFHATRDEKGGVNNSGKMRIGFVSADFKRHPVGFIIIPFFTAYDRERFEIFCYSNSSKPDDITDKIVSLVDVWRQIDDVTDQAAWQMIHDDDIDILVDLSGHTAGNRLVLFSMRPAPVQVTWLGYFDTTGLDSIDYVIMDHFVTLPSEERWFTEKFAYLPDSRFCYAPPEYAPDVVNPPCMMNAYVTFGSFNNITKLTEDVIALWAEVLRQVNASRLIIKWKNCHDNALISSYRELFRKYGLEPDGCVEFRGESSHQEMLRQYGDVDIALDPFPFSGGLTSLETLWMGVPIITLKGDRLVSRQTASFLEILNHAELVADSAEQYLDCAVSLASDIGRLSILRRALREQMCRSPLCNAAAFAHNISTVFERITLRRPMVVLSEEQQGDIDKRCNEAAQFVDAGKLDEAEACYEAALSRTKVYPRALHGLGVVRYRKGNTENGIELVSKAIDYKPDYVDALLNLGKMLHEQGRLLAASQTYQKVVSIKPDDQSALFLTALLLSKAGEREHAIIAYQRLIAIAPNQFDAIFNMGQILLETRQFDDAEAALQHAHDLVPDNIGVLIALGNLALNRRAFVTAEKHYMSACTINPESAEVHTNLGHLYSELKRTEEAITYCKRAVELKPDFALGWVNLGCAFERSAQLSEALNAFKRSLEIDPDFCSARSSMIMLMHYIPDYSPLDIYYESMQWDKIHGSLSSEKIDTKGVHRKVGCKLKIGFVSPDLHRHPVGYFVQAFLLHHNKRTFDVFCYSDVSVEDDMTQALRESADVWRSVSGLDDKKLFEIIKSDEIDILVDLAGHTAGNRLKLFALKPSPVQVTWAGYVGTTGLCSIDYLISDDYQSPHGAEEYTVERIVRMPNDYICYSPPSYAPEVSRLPAFYCGYVTFCSFNNLAKVSSKSIGLWSEILKRVPQSRLLMKTPSFDDHNVVKRYQQLFELHGIACERLHFEGQSPPREMIGRYSGVDIQLDTFPYSGGLTTLESLWMGVPVVTLPGQLFSSRHSLTHLMNVGLGECVAATPDEFITIACRLAGDLERLSELRAGLRKRMSNSPVCDAKRFTNNLQRVFSRMWHDFCGIPSDCHLADGDKYNDLEMSEGKTSETIVASDAISRGLLCLEQKDFLGAAELFEQVVAVEPNNADAHNNLGIAYFEIGFRDDAKEEFKSATMILPDHAEAWKNLGKAIRDTGGNPELAARCFRKALSIAPDFDDAWMMLGTTYLDRGRSVEAVKYFQKSLDMNPNNCNTHSILLFAMNYILQFSQKDLFLESLKWNENHASGITRMQHAIRTDQHQIKRLRIGYVSGDFKRHPVGYHLLPVLAAYDRERFEVYCYAALSEQDDLTEKMQGYVTEWRDISKLSDDDAAALICNDRIEILVDLSGHTGGNRLIVFASKPAPVQVSWLGYFNTTGVKAIDYLISDETTIPPEEEQWFSEKVIRLPGSRFCYAPPEYAPPVIEPPVLKNGAITFGSFNNIAKLTPEVIELWSRVLMAVPDSRLIIKWSTLSRKKVRDRLFRQFARHGVNSERLSLRGKSPHADMLKEYGDIDIALDPFPFSGGMTSCEALWMGVPVVTLLGDKPAGRQTAGFLRTIGLPEWVTMSPEQFISQAQLAASDYGQLKLLRFGLRGRMTASTLCDGVSFTRNLEALYCQMIREPTASH